MPEKPVLYRSARLFSLWFAEKKLIDGEIREELYAGAGHGGDVARPYVADLRQDRPVNGGIETRREEDQEHGERNVDGKRHRYVGAGLESLFAVDEERYYLRDDIRGIAGYEVAQTALLARRIVEHPEPEVDVVEVRTRLEYPREQIEQRELDDHREK